MVQLQKSVWFSSAIVGQQNKQNVIEIYSAKDRSLRYTVSMVQGWNNPRITRGYTSGRKVAQYITHKYIPLYIAHKKIVTEEKKADYITKLIDAKILRMYPAHVGAAGVFIFSHQLHDVCVTVGLHWFIEWTGSYWRHSPEISQGISKTTRLRQMQHTFFGRGELKDNSLYSSRPFVFHMNRGKKRIIASEGLFRLFTLTEFNAVTKRIMRTQEKQSAELIANVIEQYREKRKYSDDISFFLFNSE